MKVYFNNSCNICRAEINLYKKENIINAPNLVMEGMIIHHLSIKKLA